MREAEITCLCLSIRLADLDVVLFKGQTVYVDAARARASKDLEVARRGNGVQVRYVERCEERREPSKPMARRMVRPAPRPVPKPRPQPSPSLDVDVLAEHLRAKIAPAVGQPNDEKTRQMIREELAATLGPMLENLVGAVQPNPDAGKVRKRDKGPVFIPSKIIGDDTQADISVDREEADSDSVDSAAKALKAAKKARHEQE